MASLDLRIGDVETTNAEMPDHAFGARQTHFVIKACASLTHLQSTRAHVRVSAPPKSF